ncbi:MAG: hypothetical protein WBG86_10585 [Polyangiales bacterium]
MRAILAALVVTSAFGCTLVNDPDRNLVPPDGGVDGGMDGGVDSGIGTELFCENDTDDDQDTRVDCDDTDCDEEPACCERRRTALDEAWTAADLRIAWVTGPTVEGEWIPARTTYEGDTFVGDFGTSDRPRALISADCVSLGLGGWVATTLRTVDPTDCTDDERCERYTGLVLSTANDLASGSKLQDELAVTLHAGGLLLLTQADTEIARTAVAIDEPVDVEVTLRPTLVEAMIPMLRASVVVDGETVLEDFPMTEIAELSSTGECAQVPGLQVALEGQGDGLWAGPVLAERQDCANPGQFEKQVATLTGSSLRFGGSWRSAYVGAPTLASSRNSVADVQWDLIVEGSNDAPELEPVAHVGYALGHARETTDEGEDWSLDGWQTSGGPKAGDDPPSCIGVPEGCDGNVSAREPNLLAELNEDGSLRDLVLAFAREVGPGPPDVFGIQVVKPVSSPMTSLPIPTTPTLSPGDIPECESLRDPALIPADPDAQEGYWLFFSCVQGVGAPSEIHAVRLSRALEVVLEGNGPLRRIVLTAEELGPFAAAGIRSPEPLVMFGEESLRLRIWFLAQRAPGDWSLAMAEARSNDVGMLAFDLPEALPFVVNPILTNESPLVRSECLGDDCSITGIAVTRRADDPEVLRFVLARRVNLTGGGRTDQLIPLEQLWSAP